MAYAESTTVPVSRSRDEIEKVLYRYGASGFMYGQQGNQYAIAFDLKGRRMRFGMVMPEERTFARTKGGVTRTVAQMKSAHEQETRRRWRSLALIIKAKLEAIESGVVSLEEEFLPYIVTGDGRTISEVLKPQLAQIYEDGRVPPLLPGPR